MSIFIIGDSTASIKLDTKRPESGWGEHLKDYLKDQIEIVNKAVNGRSTKSYLSEGLFAEVLESISFGDYLIIQFGHNDQKHEDEHRYTNPFTTYQENLKYFVDQAKNKGAIPIILSSVPRRNFISKNRLHRKAVGHYPSSAISFAKREKVLSIDMYKKTKELFEYLGYEQSEQLFLHLAPNQNPNYPNGVIDNTHFSILGAQMIAGLVAKELSKLPIPLANNIDQTKLLTLIQIKEKLYASQKNNK